MKQVRTKKDKIAILIADRQPIFRMGLRRLFGMVENLRVLAEAESDLQTVHLARRLKPNLIFFQAEMAPEKLADFIARLRLASPNCKVVVTAAVLTDGEHLRFIKAGASGLILRSVDPSLFIKCAQKVTQGEIWLPKHQVAEMARHLENRPTVIPRPVETLTRRERVIISCVAEGWRNREIADHLAISEQTVKNHLRAVYDKVGVSDRLELVLYVLNQQIDLPSIPAAGVPQKQ